MTTQNWPTREDVLHTFEAIEQCTVCFAFFPEGTLDELEVDAPGHWVLACTGCLEQERGQ